MHSILTTVRTGAVVSLGLISLSRISRRDMGLWILAIFGGVSLGVNVACSTDSRT